MNFSLTFDNSSDSINFVSTNPDLVEYYVNQLNQRKVNSFCVRNSTWTESLIQDIDYLHTVLKEVNSWIEELTDWRYDVFQSEDYLNQKNLMPSVLKARIKFMTLIQNDNSIILQELLNTYMICFQTMKDSLC